MRHSLNRPVWRSFLPWQKSDDENGATESSLLFLDLNHDQDGNYWKKRAHYYECVHKNFKFNRLKEQLLGEEDQQFLGNFRALEFASQGKLNLPNTVSSASGQAQLVINHVGLESRGFRVTWTLT